MRLIWIVGGHETTATSLSKGLAHARTGVDYLIRSAHTFDEIPAAHMNNPGVVTLLDSFHPQYSGFEGLKQLRARGFTGPIYLFGEPAPEAAIEPFRKLGLSGYFPPFDRADYFFAAGLIHYQLNFSGALDLSIFLGPNGRCASDTIRDLRDFNAFGAKLANFIGRFGVDLAQLRKVLMGLSLAHVKTGSGVPTIDQSFSVYYGMDPTKVILAVPGFAKGAGPDAILNEFTDALGSLKHTPGLHASMFPEIHHVARASENLIVFGGSARSNTTSMDPMMLLTTLTFPAARAVKTAPGSVFAFGHVRPTDEMPEAQAQLSPEENFELPGNSGETLFPVESADPPADETRPDALPPSSHTEAAPEGMLESMDINKILAEPEITGDLPVQVGGGYAAGKGTLDAYPDALPSTEYSDSNSGRDSESPKTDAARRPTSELEQEHAHYRELAHHMGQDIKRLMNERREPTTDRELRDAYSRLQENYKIALADKAKTQLEVALRDKQVEMLKTQVEALRRGKPAA